MKKLGFFTKKETESQNLHKGKVLSCVYCGRSKEATSPKMAPFGNYKKGILNIGEFPSMVDDRKGKPFSDQTGKFLEKEYNKIGIDLFDDCLNINAINCAKDKGPVPHEIACCRKIVFSIIEKYQPKVIVLFGEAALQSILGTRWKRDLGNIQKWRGWQIPDQDLKAWVCPMLSPFVVNTSERNPEVKTIWNLDMQKIKEIIDTPWKRDKKANIEIIDDLTVLYDIKSDIVAFDYEATGLKPHAKGHRIVCAAVADSEDHCYSFMIPSTRKERQPFLDLLKNPRIAKIAQNMKYEDTWTIERLKTQVVNWGWDPMLFSHIEDNRPGVTGLKFQTYVQFGVVDYASEVTSYLVPKETKNGNAFNELHVLVSSERGKNQLLTYCGYDAIYEFRLAMKQIESINYDFLPF